MKKLIASILCACTISSLLVGCGSTSDQAGDTTAETQTDAESEESTDSTDSTEDAKTNADADHVINVWAFTDEVPGMIEKYKELRWNLSRGFSAKHNVSENSVQNICRAVSPQRMRIIGSMVFFYL